jgi:ribosomal protein L32E
MVIKKFVRADWMNYSKLGLRRKKKQVYRKAKGRDSKMRLKMKGNLRNISIGFRTEKKTRHLVLGLEPVMIYCPKDLIKIKKEEIGIVAKVGTKNKIAIAKEALQNKIKLANLNPKKFLRRIENGAKLKKQMKAEKEITKKERDKIKKETEKEEAKKAETKKENLEENKQ